MDDITRPKPTTPPRPAGHPAPSHIPVSAPVHDTFVPGRTPITISDTDVLASGAPALPVADSSATPAPRDNFVVNDPMQEVGVPFEPETGGDVKSLDELDAPIESMGSLGANPVAEQQKGEPAEEPAKPEIGFGAAPSPAEPKPEGPQSPVSAEPAVKPAPEPTVPMSEQVPTQPGVAPVAPAESPKESPIESPKPEATVSQAPTTSAPRHRSAGMVIVLAVVFALALIGGAGYAYLQNKKETKEATPTTNTTQTPVKNPAKASDVEKASTDLDASLKKIDDTKDYQETDLSNTTLGL